MIGLLGYFLSQNRGFNFDILHTAMDTMRTLAILSVIVFGSFMLFRELTGPRRKTSCPYVPAAAPLRVRSTVTLTTEQFNALMAMASQSSEPAGEPAGVLAPAASEKEPEPKPEPVEKSEKSENTEPVVVEEVPEPKTVTGIV